MTEPDGVAALEAELGEPPDPALVAALDVSALARLAALVAEAKENQVAELARGGEAALTIVPRVVHQPLRRALGL